MDILECRGPAAAPPEKGAQSCFEGHSSLKPCSLFSPESSVKQATVASRDNTGEHLITVPRPDCGEGCRVRVQVQEAGGHQRAEWLAVPSYCLPTQAASHRVQPG